jgi:hypothetical protein
MILTYAGEEFGQCQIVTKQLTGKYDFYVAWQRIAWIILLKQKTHMTSMEKSNTHTKKNVKTKRRNRIFFIKLIFFLFQNILFVIVASRPIWCRRGELQWLARRWDATDS